MKKIIKTVLLSCVVTMLLASNVVFGAAVDISNDDKIETTTAISEETTTEVSDETTESTEPETTEKEEEPTVHVHNYTSVIEPADFFKGGVIVKTCVCGDQQFEYIGIIQLNLGFRGCEVDYYDGTVKKPVIKMNSGENTLVEGVDYEVTTDREMLETGMYTVKIVLKGERYSGEIEKNYNIICPTDYAVKLYSAESSKDGVHLSWEHVYANNKNLCGTVGYMVYRKTKDTGWKLIGRNIKDSEFIDTTAVYGETYIYTVKHYYEFEGDYFYGAYDKTGTSVKSEHISTPKAPNLSLNGNYVRLQWSKIPGATKYILYRSTSEKSGYKKIYTGTATKFNDKTVSPGNFYYYKLKYYVGSKVSTASDFNKFVFEIKAPQFDEFISVTDKSKTLSWGKIDGADGYILYRRASIKDPWKKIVTIKNGNTTSHKDKTSGAHYYLIKAYYTAEGKNNYVTGSTCRVITVGKTEKIKVSTNKNTLTNTVKWSKVSGASGYLLYAKISDGEWQIIAETDASTRSFTHSVSKNGTYYYNVVAYRGLLSNYSLGQLASYVKIKVSYLPEFKYELPSKKQSAGSFVPVKIKNLGSKTIRIYSEELTQIKNPESDIPLEIKLNLYTGKKNSSKVDYIDIPAGATKTFYVRDSYNNFDFRTADFLGFGFLYDGGLYVSAISYLYGSTTIYMGRQ